jgi:hypothetical protein
MEVARADEVDCQIFLDSGWIPAQEISDRVHAAGVSMRETLPE